MKLKDTTQDAVWVTVTSRFGKKTSDGKKSKTFLVYDASIEQMVKAIKDMIEGK
jgi:hypothetical protein